MKSVIMAGGSGTRLWPFSRKHYPKQFLSIFNDESFIQLTAGRLLKISSHQDIYTVAGGEYTLTIKDHLSRKLNKNFENLIIEPSAKNTAPAIALSIIYLRDKSGMTGEEIMFFSPSDHIISPESTFVENVKSCINLAKDYIITFGIKPTKPDTGFGYIECDTQVAKEIYKVKRFVEKPNLKKAEEYVSAGNFYWNSGMFMFSMDVILKAFEKYYPELYNFINDNTYEEAIKKYNELTSISIDYAVMEKADNIVCRKMEILWNDIGSWDSVYDVLEKDENNNVIIGDVETKDVKNSLIISKGNLTTIIGLNNVAVIETEDAVLVSDRKASQNVKDIVDVLKNKKRREIEENLTTYRPWGSYTILEESERYKIKKIIVNEGASLSLQRHHHRSEHWVVVKGTAYVVIGNEEKFVHENESVYIPKSVVHRLSNPGKIPLEIIEVQNGEYVGEDDIERLEDKYGRIKN